MSEPIPRWAQGVLVGGVALHVAVAVLNLFTFGGTSYDEAHHLWRASTGGLEVDRMAYNPPPYYVPALIAWLGYEVVGGPGSLEDWVLALLRSTNVVYLTTFYVCWLWVSLPRLLPDWRTRLVASCFLLALPGYNKLALMVHPDNLFAASSAVAIAAFLVFRERPPTVALTSWYGVVVGLVGLTRPFALVPVLVLWVAGLDWVRRYKPWVVRAIVLTGVVGGVAGSWHVYRAVAASAVLDAYKESYMEEFVANRDDFDFVHYFGTFYFEELLRRPNRTIEKLDKKNDKYHNLYANSFFTTLYSETWSDHWLYASGRRLHEEKKSAKQILLVGALPITVAWVLRLLAGLGRSVYRIVTLQASAAEWAVLGWFVLGVALFLWWQTGPALLPGKNSTIKFIYIAPLYPLALTLAFSIPVSRWTFWAWLGYLAGLYALALPIVIFVW